MEREAALADFETARKEWEAAFANVPDGALTYLKPGDDYSLGGLQVHVNWVLVHYLRVLDGIVAGGFAAIGPQDPAAEVQRALEGARRGLAAGGRRGSPEEMAKLHAAHCVTGEGLAASDLTRKGPGGSGAGERP